MTESAPPNQTFLQKFLKGGAWSLFIRAFAELSTLLISMIVARLLAPDQVGTYFLIVSLVSFIVVFSLLGLNIAIVRIIAASNAAGEKGVVYTAIWKSRLGALLSSFAIAALLYFVGLGYLSEHVFNTGAIYDLRLLIAIWIVLWSMESLNAEIFRGFKQFHLAVFFTRFAPNVIILVLSSIIFLSNLEIELHDYLHVVLFGWLVSVAVSSFLLKQRFLDSRERSDVSYHHLFSTSIPLWFTAWITFSLPRLDLWILGAFESQEMLALYGAASRLVLIVSMPLFIIQAVVPPLIAETYAVRKMDDLSRGLQTAAALAFYPGLALCLVYFFAGDKILALVFGEYYAGAYLVLQALTVGVIFRIFAASSQSLLNMTGHGRTSMTISISTGLLMVFACMYAGREYGMTGIAIAAALTVSLHNILNLVFARIRVGIWVVPLLNVTEIKRLAARR